MSENKKTKLNYIVEMQPKEYGPEDFDYSEKAEQNLSDAENIQPSLAHSVKNLATDIVTPAVGGKLAGKIIGKIVGNVAIKSVQEAAKETAQNVAQKAAQQKVKTPRFSKSFSKVASKVAEDSNKHTDELMDLLDENKRIATSFANREISPRKAISTILKNTEREAEIGPNFVEDVYAVLAKDSKKSPRAVKRALKNFVKKNENNLNDVILLAAKDSVTFGHSIRVGKLAKKVGIEAGLTEEAAEKLAQAAFLHDIGKLGTPARVVNSTAKFSEHPELRDIINSHDVIGEEILEKVNPYWANIAKQHHPNNGHGTSNDSQLVTITDLYDAITSPRSYKTDNDKNFALNNERGIPYNIGKGETTEEYLDILKRLDKKGLLPEYYEVEDDLADIFPALRANKLKDKIRKEYERTGSIDGIIAGLAAGLSLSVLDADKGGVLPTDLPSISEIKEYFIPSSRDKKELIDDINLWYKKGLFENKPEAIKAIANTDFSKSKEVIKLWKELAKINNSRN